MSSECRIWVGGLPSDISEPELFGEFSKYGAVESISIRSSPRDTFAFVQMVRRAEAEAAISKLNRSPIWGTRGLQVRIAHHNPNAGGKDGGKGAFVSGNPRRLLPMSPERDRPPDGEWQQGDGRWQEEEDRRRYNRPPSRAEDDGRRYDAPPSRPVDDRDPYDLWSDLARPPQRDEPHHRGFALGDRNHEDRHDDYGEPGLQHDGRRGGSALACSGHSPWHGETSPHRDCGPPVRRPYPRSKSRSPQQTPRPGDTQQASEDHALHQQAEWRAQNLAICIQNLPPDMSWLELKNLGRMYGYVAYARCYRDQGLFCGALEFSKVEDKERVVKALDGQMIQGCSQPLKVLEGVPPTVLLPGCSGVGAKNWGPLDHLQKGGRSRYGRRRGGSDSSMSSGSRRHRRRRRR